MPSSAFQTCALRSEEHTSELQSHDNLVCRLLLEKNQPCTPTRPLARQAAGAQLHPDQRSARSTVSSMSVDAPPPPRSPLSPHTTLFFFNDTATTEIYTLSLHDALPISGRSWRHCADRAGPWWSPYH